MEHLIGHYQPQTIKIAEHFKFFKCSQKKGESITEFITELPRLAKTCNFGDYLNTAIRDQFICGLSNTKCQKEQLCIVDLTTAMALQKAQAEEVISHEAKAKQEPSHKDTTGQEEDMHKLSIQFQCCCCGKKGYSVTECKFKKASCYLCQKVGHLARVYQATLGKSTVGKDAGTKVPRDTQKRGSVQVLRVDEATSDNSSEDHLPSIFQLGKKANKYMIMQCMTA